MAPHANMTMAFVKGLQSTEMSRRSLLLRGVLLLIRLLLGLQQAELVESLVSSGLTKGLVCGELGFLLSNFARRLGSINLNHRNDCLRRDLGGNVHLFLGGVSLVRLAQLLGEEDELGSVLLETLHVLLQGLDAFVAATVVNRDADRSGEVLVEAGSLNLLQSEAPSETLFLVVFNGRASDDGPERGGGSRRDTGSLSLPGIGASDLSGRLVEPGFDAVLPILLEMGVLNDVVVLGSHGVLFEIPL